MRDGTAARCGAQEWLKVFFKPLELDNIRGCLFGLL